MAWWIYPPIDHWCQYHQSWYHPCSNPMAISATNACQNRPFQPWRIVHLTRTGPSAVQETRAHRTATVPSGSWNKLAYRQLPKGGPSGPQGRTVRRSKISPTGTEKRHWVKTSLAGWLSTRRSVCPSFLGSPKNVKFLSLIFEHLADCLPL
jgi:hypothetical protein